MKTKDAYETLIIGAGPAGLAAAMTLSNKDKDFLVVEKQSSVGGLAKTLVFTHDGLTFRTDIGPHRFFSKNPHLYQFVEDLLHEQWIPVKRCTRQYIDGKFYDYPINVGQALKNIGVRKATRMLYDYAAAKIKYDVFRSGITTFADYVYANFGKSLGEFNMINYTEKIWGIPAHEIHADWARQRIKGLNMLEVVKEAIMRQAKFLNRNTPRTLIDTFYYPEFGTGLIYEKITERLCARRYEVMTDAYPTKIFHSDSRVTHGLFSTPAGTKTYFFQNLIESIPVPAFLDLFDPPPPPEIIRAKKNLRFRNQVYLFLLLDKPSVFPDQWIYIPDKQIPFGRLSEMKNFSAKMSPPGKTSLLIEFFCFDDEPLWTMDAHEVCLLALPHLEKMDFVRRGEVIGYHVFRQSDVYPIYDIAYQEYLSAVQRYLDSFQNLFYHGRPGRFRYTNQDHSLEMGMMSAQSVIDGRRYDLNAVGGEEDYFEKGAVPVRKT